MFKHKRRGFTLIELLIVIAIIAILVVIALSMVKSNRDKATDSRIKSDLHRLKVAFEDYHADNGCYPPPSFFDDPSDCGSAHLAPYLSSIPCNQKSNNPYTLERDPSGCEWFKIYANLLISSDPQALKLCSSSGSNLGNYAISSDNVVPSVLCDAQSGSAAPSSAPGVSPLPQGHNYYYCSAVGNCTSFNEDTHVCTPYFVDNPNCNGTVNPCAAQQVGSCISL